MADDIVTRLRRITAKPLGLVLDPPPHPLCKEAADEIEQLRRWKSEATAVLAEWDAVWECAGKGALGESKQRAVVAELGRLSDEIESLRVIAALWRAAVASYEQGQTDVGDTLAKAARSETGSG